MQYPKDFWNARYGAEEYAYGTLPNVFFRNQLTHLSPGRMLLPAEGEGRNAVHAAQQGWEVTAFDLSDAGKQKALQLAADQGVHLAAYEVGDVVHLDFPADSFDAIALIYAHFPADKKVAYLRKIAEWLKPGGTLIFEAFSKDQIAYQQEYSSGGPPQIEMLFSVEEIAVIFPGFEFSLLEQTETELGEGEFHKGLASVVRCVGTKK